MASIDTAETPGRDWRRRSAPTRDATSEPAPAWNGTGPNGQTRRLPWTDVERGAPTLRLVTYLPPEAPHEGSSFDLAGHGRAAVLVSAVGTDWVVDLELGARALRRQLPGRMLDLIATGRDALDVAADLVEATARGRVGPHPLGDGERSFPAELVRLLAPLPDPPSLRDFYAFEDHVRTGFEKRGEPIPDAWFELPVYYKGNHRSILGPDEIIPWPSFTNELDYELEIAMVVGRRGRNLSVDRARDHIFGYTLMNDVSARDLQRREMQVRLGPAKSKDFATVLGPVLVTADELDVTDLRVTATIDGEVVTDAHTGDMRWTFPQMLAHVSTDEDVFPGDVYGSGTVAGGCGLEHGRMLRPGETIELHAPRLGTLRNVVGEQPPRATG